MEITDACQQFWFIKTTSTVYESWIRYHYFRTLLSQKISSKRTEVDRCLYLQVSILIDFRLAVVCIFIAHKFYSDFHYEIEDFSISSGITIKEINKLEKVILDLLEYNIILSERDYYGVLLNGNAWNKG